MPRVPSTHTAPGSARAGSSSSTTRSRRTGWCRCAGGGVAMPVLSVGSVCGAAWCWVVLGGAAGPVLWSPSAGGLSLPVARDGGRRPGTAAAGGRIAGPARNGAAGSEEPRDHLLGLLGERLLAGLEVARPRGAVPDLDPAARADDRAVAGQPGVLPQGRGGGEPALAVGRLVVGPGEEHPQVVPDRLGRGRPLLHPGGHPFELVRRVDEQAPLLALRDDEAVGEPVAELRRQEQPALLVEAWGVGTEEHRPRHLPARPCFDPASTLPRTPMPAWLRVAP